MEHVMAVDRVDLRHVVLHESPESRNSFCRSSQWNVQGLGLFNRSRRPLPSVLKLAQAGNLDLRGTGRGTILAGPRQFFCYSKAAIAE